MQYLCHSPPGRPQHPRGCSPPHNAMVPFVMIMNTFCRNSHSIKRLMPDDDGDLHKLVVPSNEDLQPHTSDDDGKMAAATTPYGNALYKIRARAAVTPAR